MSTCLPSESLRQLDFPSELDDLSGLVHADLQAIVRMVTERAHEKLFLTQREFRSLQTELWNRLVETLNQAVEPLTAEVR
jgi:hypothetical protein